MNEATEHFVIAAVSYLLGIFSGLAVSETLRRKGLFFFHKDNGNFIVLIVVTFAWLTSVIVDIISPVYETSPYIHGLMGAIVGFFYRNQKEKDAK